MRRAVPYRVGLPLLICSMAVILASCQETATLDNGLDSGAQQDLGGAIDSSRTDSGATPDPDSGVTPDPDSGATPDPDSGVTPDPDSGVTPDPDSGGIAPNARYVATTGDNGNDGQSEATAWRDIAYAVNQVQAGTTIYVRAGTYTENVVFAKNGAPGQPIVLEGYQSTPGDSPTFSTLFTHQSSLDPTLMPLLDGGDRTTGIGIDLIGQSHITVRNLQITRYETGIDAWGVEGVVIDNVVVTTAGDTSASYSGKGIKVGSQASNTVIKNCVVVNAAAEGISLSGDNNLIDGCRIYADDDSTANSAMDYYIVVAGNDNTVTGSHVERVGDLIHGGHGIGLKGTGELNTISNNTATNFAGGSFYVRHRGIKNNHFVGNTATDGSYGLVIRDGASNNTIEDHTTQNMTYAVSFWDTTEDDGKQFTGRDNLILDSSFTNTTSAVIHFSSYVYNDSMTENNVFDGVTIDGAPHLFFVQNLNSNNSMKNSTVSNVQNLAQYSAPYATGDLDFIFESSNTFINNGFPTP